MRACTRSTDVPISGKASTSIAPTGIAFRHPQHFHKAILELRRRLTVSFASDSTKADANTLRSRASEASRAEISERDQVTLADDPRSFDLAAVRPGTPASARQLGDALARGDWRLAASIADSLNSLGNDIGVEEATRFITGEELSGLETLPSIHSGK